MCKPEVPQQSYIFMRMQLFQDVAPIYIVCFGIFTRRIDAHEHTSEHLKTHTYTDIRTCARSRMRTFIDDLLNFVVAFVCFIHADTVIHTNTLMIAYTIGKKKPHTNRQAGREIRETHKHTYIIDHNHVCKFTHLFPY